MCCTCYHASSMARMLQIRNVPDLVHRRLKARAAEEGISLSDLLLREATRVAEQPTRAELLERIGRRSSVIPSEPISEAIHAERVGR